ncbi:hypothetical protein [Enterobacter kobei]|uniref:hypothetical protein n=1 Tax=Enterobacter kobei TaxID=208224 RepID=UPI0022DE476D|nr:hypothetical protein [Enterobacter kobei]WBN89030.1 hypothetical protein KJE18_22880 [Enterobacter kobei]
MIKILTTAEHNQARADLATLTAIVENYAVTHPKKHGWSTLGALCMPAVFVFAVGGEPAEFGKNRTLRFSGHP